MRIYVRGVLPSIIIVILVVCAVVAMFFAGSDRTAPGGSRAATRFGKPPAGIGQARLPLKQGAAPALFGTEVADILPAEAVALGLPQDVQAVIVDGVAVDGTAGLMGIQPNDAILRVNGWDVVDSRGFWSLIAGQQPGSTVVLDARRGKQAKQFSFTVPVGAYRGGRYQSYSYQPAAFPLRSICPLR